MFRTNDRAAERGARRARTWLALPLLTVLPAAALAFRAEPQPLPDFDAAGGIRVAASATNLPAARAAALDRIASRAGAELKLSVNARTGAPRKLLASRPLTERRVGPADVIAREFLERNRDVWGLGSAAAERLVLEASYADRASGTTHVYFMQKLDGVPLFTGVLQVSLDPQGRVTGVLGDAYPQVALAAPWKLSPEEALRHAAAACEVELEPRRSGQDAEVVVFDRGPLGSDVRVERFVYPLLGAPRPAYRMLIDKNGREWYDVLIDAATGALLHRRNLYQFTGTVTPSGPPQPSPAAPRALVYTEHPLATIRGTGDLPRRYPYTSDPTGFSRGWANSPLFDADTTPTNDNDGNPTNATIDQTLLPLPSASNPLRSNALPLSSSPQSPAGWFTTVAGQFVTSGNNVDAKDDHAADDEATIGHRASGGTTGDFSGAAFVHHNFYAQNGPYPSEGTLQPASVERLAGGAPDLDAAVVNLFYVNNWYHDFLYHLGFTEAAGNFQNDNFGLGGAGGDAVFADAQDGSGTNNANFGTPPDGLHPRMQMFLFGGPERDGDFDFDIVIHEYTHGLSNRLVGGPSTTDCLGTPLVGESGGMGEGWGDWYAAMITDEPTIAEYSVNDPVNGIRRFSLDHGPSDFTYGFLCSGPPSNPSLTPCEVHDVGEFWALTLWEMREAMINRWHNRGGGSPFPTFTAAGTPDGNIKNAEGRTSDGSGDPALTDHQAIENATFDALFRVTDGMKLAPCNPTIVDMRDAILAADRALGGEHQDLIWRTFANRGVGTLAASTGGGGPAGATVESFEVPATVLACEAAGGPLPSPAFTAVSNANNQVTLTIVANGATEYVIYRSTAGAGSAVDPLPFTEITRIAGTSYTDSGLDGGRTYWYRVRALRNDDCTSGTSVESVVPQGSALECTTLPSFAGLGRVIDAGDCTHLRLDWAPATSNCPGGPSIVYNVYRSTQPFFAPGGATLLAAGVSGLSFEDAPGADDRLFYYIVRAEDGTNGHGGPADDGNEDDNTTTRFGLVTSGLLRNQGFQDDVESGPDDGRSAHFGSSGTQVPTIPERGGWFRDGDAAPVVPRSPTTVWHTFNPDNPVITPNDSTVYELRSDMITITPESILTFHHTFETEAAFDGGVVEYALVLDAATGAVGPFQDLGFLIFEGRYNGVLDATIEGLINNNPLANRQAYTGGRLGPLERSRAFLGALVPQGESEAQVVVRFLFGNDVGNTQDPSPQGDWLPGWYIDDVSVDESCCPLSPAPANLVAEAAVGSISLSWDAPGGTIASYEIYREASNDVLPVVFDERLAVVPGNTTSFTDDTVSTAVLYHYVVRAVPAAGCPSAQSNVASASPLGGACLADPTFAGLESVSASPEATCALLLRWDAGSANCFGAGVRYDIWRDTNPGFLPTATNLLATGVTGLSYLDQSDLPNGVTWYYIVRAEDTTTGADGPANGGNMDDNLVRKSGRPIGELMPGPDFSDDLEPAAEPGYTTFSTRTTGGWQVLTDATAHSSSRAWVALDDQPGLPQGSEKDDRLTLPELNLATSSVLRFWHNFDFARFPNSPPASAHQSGGVLELSADGQAWIDLGPYITMNGYNGVVDPEALNPLAGRAGWVGSSDGNLMVGRTDAMRQVVVNLGAAIQTELGVTELAGARVRFRLGGTFQLLLGGVQGSGWGIDDLSVSGLLTPGACLASPGEVTDLVVDKLPANVIRLSWGASCSSGAEDYGIYEGLLGDWYSHTQRDCLDGGADRTEDLTPLPGNRYYLVVPYNAAAEGSYGTDSGGTERPPGDDTCVPEQVTVACP